MNAKEQRYLFVGNRKFVLEAMVNEGLTIAHILVIKGSYLENDIKSLQLPYTLISSKTELLSFIQTHERDFDILVSNGCPFILPISKLPSKKYINIHPSFLPDLKGIDPCIGAILHKRDGGATCHLMDDTIDEGDILSQVKIPYSDDLDISLMYQLSFKAEPECFLKAVKANFESPKKQITLNNAIYYNRSEKDKHITFKELPEDIVQKVKAFQNKSQGCSFTVQNQKLTAHDAQLLSNPYLQDVSEKHPDRTILFAYEDTMIIKYQKVLLKLSKIQEPTTFIKTNESL